MKSLLTILLFCSLFASAQPGGYVPGTFVNWNFNSRDHGIFIPQGFNSAPDSLKRVHVHMTGLGETNASHLTTEAPGKYLNDLGTNWDGKVVRANGDTIYFAVFYMLYIGYLPTTYASDLNYFFANTANLPDTSKHRYYSIGGFSAGPGSMWGTLKDGGTPYANVFGTTLSVSPTYLGIDVSTISEGRRNIVFRNGDDANGGTPEGAANDLFTALRGFKSIKKPASTGQGHSADSAYSIYGVANNALTDSSKSFWRLVSEWVAPVPDTTTLEKIPITPEEVYNISDHKDPQDLFDGDTSTVAIKDPYEGFVIQQTGIVSWVDLQGYWKKFRIRFYNKNNSFNHQVKIRFFRSWQDTTVKSAEFTYLTTIGWNTIDTTLTKAVSDSFSFMRVIIMSGAADKLSEMEVYGKRASGTPPSLFLTGIAPPEDLGLAFMGYGKLNLPNYWDSAFAGMSIREQNDMFYIDTCTVCPDTAHTYIMDKFQDEYNLQFTPLKNLVPTNDKRLIYPYYAGPSRKNMYVVGDNNSKDIPIGSDSTLPASWVNQRKAVRFVVDTLGPKINMIAFGNEDPAKWSGDKRYHSPLVLLAKYDAMYQGIRESKYPNMGFSLGADVSWNVRSKKAIFLLGRMRHGIPNYLDSAKALEWNQYYNTFGGQGGSNTDGVSPEQNRADSGWKVVVRFRNKYFPRALVIHSEIGYDTVGTNYNVQVIPGRQLWQTQGAWQNAAWDQAAFAQVDMVAQYTQTCQSGGDFSQTGFVTSVPIGGGPAFTTIATPLAYYIGYRKEAFAAGFKGKADTTFRVNGDSTGVNAYRWEHQTNANKKLFSVRHAAWNGSTSNYVLNIGPNAVSATARSVSLSNLFGTTTSLTPSGTTITIPVVNEDPIYIEVTYSTPSAPVIRNRKFRRIKIS